MIKAWVLNWKNQLEDFEVSQISSVFTQWISKGCKLESDKITAWNWFIEVERTNWPIFLLWFTITEDYEFLVWNNKKVWLEVDQEKIDNAILVKNTWEDIVLVNSWGNFPVYNHIPLWETNWWWVITDKRIYSKIKFFNWTDILYAWMNDWFFEINT